MSINKAEIIARLTDIIDIPTTDPEEWADLAMEEIQKLQDDLHAGKLELPEEDE